MDRKFIDEDPLNNSRIRMGGTYETSRHKLKLCTPDFPIHEHGDFILLGSDELIDEHIGNHVEIYSKKEWLVEWCKRKIEDGFGWYLLREIAPLLLRELENRNKYIHFYELIKESELEQLNAQIARYEDEPLRKVEYNGYTHMVEMDAETLRRHEYTGGGNLSESVLIRNSTNLRKALFGDLLRHGKVVMMHHEDGRLKLIEEVEYYGSGIQAAPLAGSGGVYFMYRDKKIHYSQTWIS